MKFKQAIYFFLSLILLMGCSCHIKEEPHPLPSQALENAVVAIDDDSLIIKDAPLPEDWWTLFNDPQLSDFIEQALAKNPTLQAARAQILSAAAMADRVRSTLYPTLDWDADVSRQKLSETGIVPLGGPSQSTGQVTGVPIAKSNPSKIPIYFTLYETEFVLKYDFDFWGKNRNTVRAALGDVQAKVAEEAFARLQLSTSVALIYFKLQIDYKREEVAKEQVREATSYRNLIKKRILANVDNAFSLEIAEYNLADTTQFLLAIQGDIAVNEHQLKAYLAGDFTETIVNTKIIEQPLPQVPLPTNLPLHLLARRPDITAQLWVIESAGRLIDVAKAGFYPDFNLTAFYGYQTIHFREFFKYPSAYYSVDPAVSLPLFEGGRLEANLRSSEIDYDLAIFKYNDLVLNATREVLDGIIVLRNSVQQLEQRKLKTAHQESLSQLTNLRVTHHLNTSLDQSNRQTNTLTARDQEVVAEGKAIESMILLIKALGGGYEVCDEG